MYVYRKQSNGQMCTLIDTTYLHFILGEYLCVILLQIPIFDQPFVVVVFHFLITH